MPDDQQTLQVLLQEVQRDHVGSSLALPVQRQAAEAAVKHFKVANYTDAAQKGIDEALFGPMASAITTRRG